MEIIFFLLPVSIFLGLIGVIFFFWSVRSGQFEDIGAQSVRILFDDDRDLMP